MRVGKLATAVGATACLLGAGSVALAASHPKGGKVRVFVTTTSPTKGKILITGAIGDYGTTISEDANGKVNPNGNFEKTKLKQGGFIVNTTALNNKLNHTKPAFNKSNCSVVLSGSGPVTLSGGTGAYTGIAGTIRVTVTFAGIVQKTAKGCSTSPNAPTHGQYQSITGTGTVSFK